VGGLVAFAVVGLGIPITIIVTRVRTLLRLGYGPDDIAAGLRAVFERRREEFQFEFGPRPSAREKLFRYAGAAGLATAAGLAVLPVIGIHQAGIAPAAVMAL